MLSQGGSIIANYFANVWSHDKNCKILLKVCDFFVILRMNLLKTLMKKNLEYG